MKEKLSTTWKSPGQSPDTTSFHLLKSGLCYISEWRQQATWVRSQTAWSSHPRSLWKQYRSLLRRVFRPGLTYDLIMNLKMFNQHHVFIPDREILKYTGWRLPPCSMAQSLEPTWWTGVGLQRVYLGRPPCALQRAHHSSRIEHTVKYKTSSEGVCL